MSGGLSKTWTVAKEAGVGDVTVAIQGVPGAYSEAAAAMVFGTRARMRYMPDFPAVFAALAAGRVTRAVVPIENSLAGSIHQNYDLLREHAAVIQGEVMLRVEHNLLAPPGLTLADVREVFSHPQALAQCAASLRALRHATPMPFFDTAGAAAHVAETRPAGAAAIASRHAARIYGLRFLKRNLEDDPENFTRFFVLGKKAAPRVRGKSHKTTLVFALRSMPGALQRCLTVFALRDVDLHKIESRPIAGRPWEYRFYVDVAGHADDEALKRSLGHLAELALDVRVLGSYPAAQRVGR